MKCKLNNEEGYTLLVALGIMMMLVLFMFSFTRIAVSQKVQVEKTDQSIVTTALAEMGGEYFKEYVIDDIEKRVTNLEAKVDGIIQLDITNIEKDNKIKQEIEIAHALMKNDYSALISQIGSVTEINGSLIGYKINNYFMTNPRTIHYITSGFAGGVEGNEVEIELDLPERLMWRSEVQSIPNQSMSFSEYATTGSLNGVLNPSKETILNDSNGYEFDAGAFYYFDGGRTFPQGQFNENQGRSLTNIDVYSDGDISFYKHFKIIDTNIVTKNLFIEFSSNAQGEIVDSTIVTTDLTINKGNQSVKFSNSTICFTGESKPSSLNTSQSGNLFTKLDFSNGAKIIYHQSGIAYVMTSDTSTQTATASEIAKCSPTRTGTSANYSYESYNSEDIDYQDVIYN